MALKGTATQQQEQGRALLVPHSGLSPLPHSGLRLANLVLMAHFFLHLYIVTFPTRLISNLKREAICTSETLAPTYHTMWCHNPEHHNKNFHSHENLKYYVIFILCYVVQGFSILPIYFMWLDMQHLKSVLQYYFHKVSIKVSVTGSFIAQQVFCIPSEIYLIFWLQKEMDSTC
jgi:hypothetical protein